MQDNFNTLVRKDIAQRSHIVQGERIDEKHPAGYRYLDEAYTFGILEEPVRFQINSNAGLLTQRLHDADEEGLVVYEFKS